MRLSWRGSTWTSVTCRARSVCAADPPPLFVGARSRRHLTDPLGSSPPAYGLAHHPGEPPHGTRRATRRRPAAQAHKGQGQWALGHLEPLTPNERVKKDDDGLNVRARIENIYSKAGFASIDPADLRGRLRWWGLYTQRRPGIDGGKTAVLEPHELDDEYFMLRVRIDGGQLTTEQLRVIARDLLASSPGTPPTSPTGRTSSCTGSGSRTCRRSGAGSRRSGCRPPRPAATPRGSSSARPSPASRPTRSSTGRPADRGDPRAVHRVAGVLQPAAQVQDRDQRLAAAGRRARGQRHLLRRRRAPRARPGLRPVGRRRPVDQPDAGPAARRLGAAGRGADGVGRRRRRLPRLRLPAAAHPGPDQVPGRRLGRRRSSARCSRRSTSAARSSTGPLPRCRTARATTSACTGRTTAATTSGWPRRSAGSPARRWPGWPTSPRRTGRSGCGPRRTRSSSCSTCRPTGSTRWSTPRPGWGCGPSRAPSGATRWPAPASSSASWRSSRPRLAGPS